MKSSVISHHSSVVDELVALREETFRDEDTRPHPVLATWINQNGTHLTRMLLLLPCHVIIVQHCTIHCTCTYCTYTSTRSRDSIITNCAMNGGDDVLGANSIDYAQCA